MKVPSKITIPTKIINNRFGSNKSLIRSVLESYEGDTIEVTFVKPKNKRTNRQNRYYWSVIVPIIQNCIKNDWGEVVGLDYVNEFLKHNCNFEEVVNEDTGEVLKKVKSSTENNTIQQEEFYSKCRNLAKNFFNTEIPLPNTEIEIKF